MAMADAPSIECVGSTCFVDPEPLPEVRSAVCPACGQVVAIGGWPARYLVHREPAEDASEAKFPATFRGLGAS